MKLQFDPNQPYQLDAVAAVTDLFDGQPQGAPLAVRELFDMAANATRPDEPHSVDAIDKAQEAIKALNPLCTLRYSATHRNPYNLVFRLDPGRAFELKLVKQIVVVSATADSGMNDAFVRVEKIDYARGIKAKLRIHMQTPQGPKEKSVAIKNGTDLYTLSNERACYQDGFVVAEISAEPGNEYLRFNNGRVLRLGQETGSLCDDVWRAQINHTVLSSPA